MANKWEEMTQEELVKRRDENSAAWAPADDVERARLHDENVEIMGELDRRGGTTSTFDSASGTWSTKAAQPDYTKLYGSQGGNYGAGAAPEYSGAWQKTTDDLTRQAMGMSYADWTQGDDYRSLAGRYRDMGRAAMDDTVGMVSARTGGLASSYATTAAQQQYDRYLSQLEQVARQMYAAQRGDAVQNAQLAGAMADREYQQYLNRLSQYNTDRAFGYGVYRDGVEDLQKQQRFDRSVFESDRAYDRGVLESDRDYDFRMDQTRWQREQQEREEARAQLDAMLKSGKYQAWELPWELVEKAGYSPFTWEALEQSYAQQRQPQQTAAHTYSGSSGGGNSSPKGGLDYDGLFEEARKSGHPQSFLAQKDNYQKYGFTSSSGLYSDYQAWVEERQTSPKGMGTDYNTIFENTKYMSRGGVSDDQIIAYLRQFTDEQLTEAGWEAIAMGLDLNGYRTKRGNT